jgi:ribonuclease HI
MPLTPEMKKLLQQTLKIRDSHVPLHRVIDILATAEGDISTVIHRFRDIKDQDLRRALHNCAVLLRELEREAGLQPAWEAAVSGAGKAQGTPGQPATGQAKPQAKAAAPAKPKYRPEDLQTFESEELRGRVKVAKVYVDGASKGNPGEAGVGVAMFTMDGQKIAQMSLAIGIATNNIAEYTALIEALKLGQRMGVQTVFALSDSELMVKQMNGIYKIKNPDILQKVKEAKGLTKKFEKFSINYVERENNTLADALSGFMVKQVKKAAAEAAAGADEGHLDVMTPLELDPDEGTTGEV